MVEQLTLSGIRLQDAATFENFNADNNEQVVDFLKAILHGEELFAYLWGGQGAGRSHLLQAVCHQAHEMNKTAMYIPLSEFILFSPDVFDGLEAMDIVAIDDVELLAGQAEWEEALFHLFNRLRNANKHLIISANSTANQLGVKLADLLSRLTWGVTFKLTPLTDEGKAKALMIRAQYRGMNLSEEAANFLLRHYARTTHALFNALDKLDIASLAEQRRLTVPFMKQVLEL